MKFSDGIIGAFFLYCAYLLSFILRFFWFVPFGIQAHVSPNPILFLYDIVFAIIILGYVLSTRYWLKFKIIYLIQTTNISFYILYPLSALIMIIYWPITRRIIHPFFRMAIPFLDEILGYK